MMDTPKINTLLLSHNCLHSIDIKMIDGGRYNLCLELSDSEDTYSEKIVITFNDISNFTVKDIGGGLTQFMHLQITKLEHGLERIKYQMSELEDSKISFSFFSYSIVV